MVDTCRKPLLEVCDLLDSKRVPVTSNKRIHGPYPYYGANGIQDYVNDYIFDDDLVLLAEDGGNFGSKDKPIAYRVSGKCWVNNHAHVLKPREGLNVDYLCYSLMYYDTKRLVNGATRKKLTQAAMKNIKIPILAYNEQLKIVKRIAVVSTLINNRKKELGLLDELVKSRFLEMFGDIELNSQNMQKMMWQEVFDTQTGKLDANAAVKGGRYPFFTCAKEISTIDEYAYDCEALLLAGNNAVGDYDVKYYKGKFNAYQRTYILMLKNRQYSYSVFKFQLEQKLRYLQLQSKGTNTRYLTMGILKSLDFIVPPIVKQQEFAQFVNATDKSKLAVQKSLDELEILKKSLMQTYFG